MRRLTVVVAAVLVALAGPPASAGMSYTARMSGDQEVSEKGPAGAKGTAKIDVDAGAGKLCYDLAYEGIPKPAKAGHVHRGAKGTEGPVVVNLDPAARGDKACVDADKAVLKEIDGNPGGFYVNLHTESHPKGAMRGQLEKG